MKKIIIIVLSLFFLMGGVFADDLRIDYRTTDGMYELVFSENGNVLSYDEASKKYNFGRYFEFMINGENYFFLDGKQIAENEYNLGKKIEDKKSVCDKELTYCFDVATQEDLYGKIEEIYTSRVIGEYHLFYTDSVYKKINFSEIDSHYKSKYMTDLQKNAYKYEEYGLIQPIKSLPYHDENEMIISTLTTKITKNEEKIVDEFLGSFLLEFKEKSDYEKVLGVYSYINKTAEYEKDNGFIKFVDGKLSPYDVLITHKTVCIGSSTTFQFLMEKLGIDSYIIDHVSDYNEKSYSTSHTYNIVKLDDNWFIVDLNAPGNDSLFLMNNNGKYDVKDFKYLGIKISDKSYNEVHPDAPKTFDMDYYKYVKLADSLLDGSNDKKENNKSENDEKDEKKVIKNESHSKYVYILSILLGLCVVIVYFTKKA